MPVVVDAILSRLELRVPPVVLAVACLAAMWALARWMPGLAVHLPWRRTIAIVLLLSGVATGIAGVAAFRRRGTTVDPTRPQRASAMVVTGVYRRTRNPMYLGLALALAGVAAWLANLAALAVIPLFVAWLTRLQIVPEERALRGNFGTGYDDYVAQVRRWL
jgi:protein-S-isoprenylcysteine O-methyltransferase Ste14